MWNPGCLVCALVLVSSCGDAENNGHVSYSRGRDATNIGCDQVSAQRLQTSALFGDSVQGSAPRSVNTLDREYRCVVNSSMPAYRVILTQDPTLSSGAILFVPDTPRATPTQVISMAPEFEIPDWVTNDALRVIDIDADGDGDLLVGKSWGGTGNTDYGLWFFDSELRRFVVDTSMVSAPFSNVVPGRACIWTHWHFSVSDGGTTMQCRRGGRWFVDSAITTTWDRKKHRVIETTETRRGDSIVAVKTRVIPDST